MQAIPPEKRRVVICTRIEADSLVVVTVRDHGGGLPKANVEKIFEHFYSTKPNGMGMGLTIVRSIVESHGGKIAVENIDGGGARFHFTLPSKA